MDIYFQSEIGTCNEFANIQSKGKKEPVTIVIAPLKVKSAENGMDLKVSYGCNLFQDCGNKSCQYSAAGRSRPKMFSKD